MSVLAALAAIAVLAVLILVHESGHFIAARSQGIYVNRFSLGFGPILWKYQGPQTEYAIRAFPLGGFVGFPDDDPDSEVPPNDPNLLRNRPVLDRAIVISAGVIANLIFAYFLLVGQVSFVGIKIPQAIQPGILITELVSKPLSVAAKAGIQPGDVILAADNKTFGTTVEDLTAFRDIIRNHLGKQIHLTVARGEQKLSLNLTPEQNELGEGSIGVHFSPNPKIKLLRITNPVEALKTGAQEFQRIVFMIFQGFGKLITNFQETASQVAGPVKIVEIGANIAQKDTGNLFFFAALISINLAVINILPLPALDGGQLAFLLIEGLFGKPVPTRVQEGFMQTGLVILLGLGIFLIFKETTQLEWVQKLFQ